ncbi:MAG TPA: hypothetical protein V6D17_00855 [Candidatus Obscuribacterales bacterium]
MVGKLVRSLLPPGKEQAAKRKSMSQIEPAQVDDGFGWIPDWRSFLADDWHEWEKALAEGKNGPGVLIGTTIGGQAALTPIESILAVALTLRGANVHVLLCDSVLPACANSVGATPEEQAQFAESGPSKCEWCSKSGRKTFEQLGLTVHRMSELLQADDYAEARKIAAHTPYESIRTLEIDGLPVGEHAVAGALRYFGRGDLEGEEHGERILRRYVEAAMLTARAGMRLYKTNSIPFTLLNHGIYVPHGILAAVAKSCQSKLSTWAVGYRKQCTVFSHDDTYHHTMLSEPTSAWEGLAWTSELEAMTLEYLQSRWLGTNDWIYFTGEDPALDAKKIAEEIGIDFAKPTIGFLTNVVWDAQLHYPANAFQSMMDCILKTVRYFGERPDVQLLIRVHPAELRGFVKSRQKVVDELMRAFPELPKNVFVIPPESSISTYAAIQQCNAAIIYGTKTGLELTSMGIPVIVAGEAWIRNKGLTLDANTEEEYFALLDKLPFAESRLSEDKTRRAKMYAFHYFFRRMIPLGMLDPSSSSNVPYKVRPTRLSGFMPGAEPGLDVICDGILKGTPFVYPAEKLLV